MFSVLADGNGALKDSLFRGLLLKMFNMLSSLFHSPLWCKQSFIRFSLCCLCDEDLVVGSLDRWVFRRTTKKVMPTRASHRGTWLGRDRGAGRVRWMASNDFVAVCSIGIIYAASWGGVCSWVSVEEWHLETQMRFNNVNLKAQCGVKPGASSFRLVFEMAWTYTSFAMATMLRL